MAFTKKTDTPDIIDQWPHDFQYIDDTDPLYDWLTPFATEYRQIDVFIDELYEQRFIETSTNRELEKLAVEAGTTRREGETDPQLRLRARIERLVSSSDGTAGDIEALLSVAFEDKDLSNIKVSKSSDTKPVTVFEVPQSYIDDIPIGRAELEAQLERAFPAGYGVIVPTTNDWELGESGSSGIGQGGLI